MSLRLYGLVSGLAAPLAPSWLQGRIAEGKEDPDRIQERFGRTAAVRGAGELIWLHGASVGEGLSLLPLISALGERRPAAQLLVTTGTVTAAELLKARLPATALHQFAPLDTPFAARRFTAYWRPSLSIFVESEIWPNLIRCAKAQGSKMALLSARLSAGAVKGWRRAPAAARVLFSSFDLVMAQDDLTAEALATLGARDDGRLNLKRLGAPLPVDAAARDVLRERLGGRPMVLAASTHPGEDEAMLKAMRRAAPQGCLVLAPRHPARALELGRRLRAEGADPALRSRQDPFTGTGVYVADTLGELGLWFSLADVAFIGGSLVEGPGGHNPLEAAQFDCPILVGPHVQNWASVYQALIEAEAVAQVSDASGLGFALERLLAGPAAAAALAKRARGVLLGSQDDLGRALDALDAMLG